MYRKLREACRQNFSLCVVQIRLSDIELSQKIRKQKDYHLEKLGSRQALARLSLAERRRRRRRRIIFVHMQGTVLETDRKTSPGNVPRKVRTNSKTVPKKLAWGLVKTVVVDVFQYVLYKLVVDRVIFV